MNDGAPLVEKIATSIIGLLGRIIPEHYSRPNIESLFLYAGVPDGIDGSSKEKLVIEALRATNTIHDEPLKVLGAIVDDFMEKCTTGSTFWSGPIEEQIVKLEANRASVREALGREGLTYIRGGSIIKSGSTSTLSLDESVKKRGLASVDIEIQRALSKIEDDPHAAAQYAGNVLEAVLKAYLDNKQCPYKSGDTLSDLWRVAADKMGLRPGDMDTEDLKKIASGLHNIVDGIMHLRNTKSGAHGKSEEQTRNINIKPRHARLAIHSAHTVAAYVLELIE